MPGSGDPVLAIEGGSVRVYNSRPDNTKAWKDKSVKIGFRWHGSTHASSTKKRIVRIGRRAARKQAEAEIQSCVEKWRFF
jgi:hypothetical protein